jgi:uncharacterized protein (TIGR03435 family)
MSKLMMWAVALWMLLGIGLNAQNISGTWQGTLKPGPQDLRVVIKLSLQDDKLAAILYSVDQGGQSVPANSVTRTGSTVKISLSAMGGSYEGKLSDDGNSITGSLNQGGASFPLNLVRATPATAWTIPQPPPPPKAMPPDAKPEFEVATIKPSKPEAPFGIVVNPSGMLNTSGSALSDLIKFAYDLNPRQISGAPAWFEMEKYDITAKPDTAGTPNAKQLKAMIQAMLADRFALKFHLDKRTMPAYAISVSKAGVKLTKNESNPNGLPFMGGAPQGLGARNITMAEVATFFQQFILELPVVDQTGLGSARYDFMLKYTPDPNQRRLGAPSNAAPAASAVPDPDAPPDLFTAMQQQLGLKIESTKAAVDVMVIDHVEKPSAN